MANVSVTTDLTKLTTVLISMNVISLTHHVNPMQNVKIQMVHLNVIAPLVSRKVQKRLVMTLTSVKRTLTTVMPIQIASTHQVISIVNVKMDSLVMELSARMLMNVN